MSEEATEKKEQEKKLLEQISELLEKDDSYSIIKKISNNATPIETAERFSNLIRYLYFNKKDVSRMVLSGRIGIQYALAEADENKEDSEKLLSLAKEMAYNLSVNAWPGWGDEGITINSTDLAAGMDCAKLNYRLAIQLEKDDEKVGNALWLIGALQMAATQFEKSSDTFHKAASKFKQAKKNEFYWMAKSYVALAEILSGNQKGDQLEKEAFEELEKIGTDDAKYFIQQDKTARKIFQK